VFYEVQSGDNLLAIAKAYGVTAEAIQEANGILDPRRLQIGQELLIPMDDTALTVPATATPTPMPYEISAINFQVSPSGRLWCLGEIENTAGVDLQQVQVAISLFDETGELLVFSTANTELDVVPRGKRAPFAVAFDTPPEEFGTYQSVPIKGLPITRLGTYYLDLEIVSHQGEARGRASYSISGRVRNAGDQPASNVRIVVTGYNADGLVAAVRKVAPAEDQLQPGRSSDFEINLLSTAGTVVTYTLAAEGLGVQAE
jgi:murein DD-endopeptidase MepM/ murein hydrolase activator NlpD